MAFQYQLDPELCKGCGLCVSVCPKKRIGAFRHGQRKGIFPGISGPA